MQFNKVLITISKWKRAAIR